MCHRIDWWLLNGRKSIDSRTHLDDFETSGQLATALLIVSFSEPPALFSLDLQTFLNGVRTLAHCINMHLGQVQFLMGHNYNALFDSYYCEPKGACRVHDSSMGTKDSDAPPRRRMSAAHWRTASRPSRNTPS
jgi:hypothetical protein